MLLLLQGDAVRGVPAVPGASALRRHDRGAYRVTSQDVTSSHGVKRNDISCGVIKMTNFVVNTCTNHASRVVFDLRPWGVGSEK